MLLSCTASLYVCETSYYIILCRYSFRLTHAFTLSVVLHSFLHVLFSPSGIILLLPEEHTLVVFLVLVYWCWILLVLVCVEITLFCLHFWKIFSAGYRILGFIIIILAVWRNHCIFFWFSSYYSAFEGIHLFLRVLLRIFSFSLVFRDSLWCS